MDGKIKYIESIINRIGEVLKTNNNNEIKEYAKEVKGLYSRDIDGFYANLSMHYSDSPDYISDLKIMSSKLEKYKYDSMAEMEKLKLVNANNITTHVTNTNTNTNTINISFEDAKEKIKVNENLSTDEVNEALDKINELEEITKSTDRKADKWNKAKEILIWTADKSIDVGIALLPLFLNIK